MRYLGYSVLLLATACGEAPELDPRHADVVVESAALEGATAEATAWWYDATGSEVAFHVAPACATGHVCVRIHLGELTSGDAGVTEYPVGHPEDATTTVSDALAPGLVGITIAHELGHLLGLAHTDGVMTALVDEATWDLPSEWPRSTED